MEASNPALTVVIALAAGVFAQSLARHLRVPGIVLLLLAGAGLGPDGLGWVQPGALGEGVFIVVDLAVAVILFEGGLNLEISRLRREQAAIRRLITWGALVTACGGMLLARILLDWDWMTALLFGTLVVVTGPTVVGPLVADLRLRPKVATVLEAEGVLIDPVGAILALLVLGIALAPTPDSIASGGVDLLLRFGFGAVAGGAAGAAISLLLRVPRIVPEGHENIFVLAAVLLVYESCELVVPHSGILCVAIGGVVVGNLGSEVSRDLREFKDQLSVLLIGLLFVMLAADVRFEQVQALGLASLAVVAGLVFVVRPLGVWLSTAGSELSARERIFIGWIAPRGIVAAALASVVAAALEGQDLEGGSELRALVFLTISITVVLAGLTAGPVGRWLAVRLPSRDTVAILTAQPLGLALAAELKAAGTPVVFLDSNPQNCRQAEEAGHAVVFGNAIQERTLSRARFERVRATVALTPNDSLNGIFVRRARELFQVPKGFVSRSPGDSGLAAELLETNEAELAFDGPHDIERWDVRFRHEDVEIVHLVYRDSPEVDAAGANSEDEGPSDNGERSIILTARRGDEVLVVSSSFEPDPGDVAAIAIHTPDRDEALRSLSDRGWIAVPPDVEF